MLLRFHKTETLTLKSSSLLRTRRHKGVAHYVIMLISGETLPRFSFALVLSVPGAIGGGSFTSPPLRQIRNISNTVPVFSVVTRLIA